MADSPAPAPVPTGPGSATATGQGQGQGQGPVPVLGPSAGWGDPVPASSLADGGTTGRPESGRAAPDVAVAARVDLCAGASLLDKGSAFVFDLLQFGAPVRAFVLRHDQRVAGYLNRCAHLPAELDWQPGEFLDAEREFIVCALHGATYEPHTGRCAGGPCGRGRLVALDVRECDGRVCWYPSSDLQPAVPETP